MKISLISYTKPNEIYGIDKNVSTLDVLFTATSQCYNESFDINDAINTPYEKKKKILKSVLNSGHTSVSEHINFTFLIEDVSRVLTHQLVRHRISSFSQRSARYTKINTDIEWYVIPDDIKTEEQIKVYTDIMKQEAIAYDKLIELGVKKESARYILGDGQKTNIVMTMNCRALKNFFGERMCTRAQKEIRDLANEMSKLCIEVLPEIFEDCKFGKPKCIQESRCTESKSCGYINKYLTLNDKIVQ